MQLKKYIGNTMQEALAEVKAELGADAVIIATRNIRPRGIFGPQRMEITAALSGKINEVDSSLAVPNRKYEKEVKVSDDVSPTNFPLDPKIHTLRNELRGLREEIRGSDIDEHRSELVSQLEEVRKLLSAYSLRTIAASDDWFVNVLENADIDLDLADEIGGCARKKFSDMASDIESDSTDGYSMQA